MPQPLALHVRVPASSANLGPGFDSVGLALGLWDDYDVVVGDGAGLRIEVSGESADEVPLDETHLVVRSMAHAAARLGVALPTDLHLVARNAIPHGRGLGSSAAAITAGVVVAQAICAFEAWEHLPLAERVPVDLDVATDLVTELEGHPDNASASVRGGMTLSWTRDIEERGTGLAERAEVIGTITGTVSVRVHDDLRVVALVPQTQLATHTARAVLPPQVDHRAAALNAGRSALLVEAMSRRPDLLLPATRDWLHQEFRRPAFAASMRLVDALRAEGHAALISGAGPSVLVLTTRDRADRVVVPVGTGGDAAFRAWRRLPLAIPTTGVNVTRA